MRCVQFYFWHTRRARALPPHTQLLALSNCILLGLFVLRTNLSEQILSERIERIRTNLAAKTRALSALAVRSLRKLRAFAHLLRCNEISQREIERKCVLLHCVVCVFVLVLCVGLLRCVAKESD